MTEPKQTLFAIFGVHSIIGQKNFIQAHLTEEGARKAIKKYSKQYPMMTYGIEPLRVKK